MLPSRRTRWVLLFAAFFVPASLIAAKPKPPAGDAVETGIWRLAGIAPGSPSADLEPLKQLIGKATVVGLGESIHTSGGYYVSKHRVFRYLVEKAGFRALGFQSSWAAADRVAAYVKTCQGSPEDALLGFDGVWQSAEVRDLIVWMCDWNRSHKKAKDKLTLFGFDVQQPEVDGPALIAFLRRLGVGEEDPLIAGTERCNGVGEPPVPLGNPVPAEDNAACMESLDAIAQKFGREAKQIIKKTSKKDFEGAKVALAGLRGNQGYSFFVRSNPPLADELRDGAMATVLRSMQTLRLPKKTKLAVWAHNFHLSKAPLPGPQGDTRTMGTFLTEALGSGFFVAGFIGWDVSVDAGPTLCGVTNLAGAASLESRLHGLGELYLLVDPKVGSSVLAPGTPLQVSGSVIDARNHYDALVFLDESARMIPLHRPPC